MCKKLDEMQKNSLSYIRLMFIWYFGGDFVGKYCVKSNFLSRILTIIQGFEKSLATLIAIVPNNPCYLTTLELCVGHLIYPDFSTNRKINFLLRHLDSADSMSCCCIA